MTVLRQTTPTSAATVLPLPATTPTSAATVPPVTTPTSAATAISTAQPPQTTPSTGTGRSALSPTNLNLPTLPSHHPPPHALPRQNAENALPSSTIQDWPQNLSIEKP